MPKATLAHKPDLTRETAQQIFAAHFQPRYRVYPFWGIFGDFIVAKNAFVGVAVTLEQTGTETRLHYGGVASKWWAQLMVRGLIGTFLWRPLTNEVRWFIERAPEFQDGTAAGRVPR